MPPDTPPVPRGTLPGTLKDSKTPSPDPSRVRTLLGLPRSEAVPLASAASLPVVELPYVTPQMGAARYATEPWGDSPWTESELDTLDNQDGAGVETLFTDSSQHLSPDKLGELPPSAHQNDLDSQSSYDRPLGSSQSEGTNPVTELPALDTNRVRETLEAKSMESENPLLGLSSTPQKTSFNIPGITQPDEKPSTNDNRSSQSEGMSPVTKLPAPDTNRVRETLETKSLESENPLSGLGSTPQKTSISIPGITQPPASSSPPSSLGSDSSLMEDENLTEQPTMPYRQPTMSSSESSSAMLADGSTLGSTVSPSPNKVAETEMGVGPEGELTDSAKHSSVDEEALTNDNGTGLSLGNQTANFSDLQRKVDPNPAAPRFTHHAAAGDSTSQVETLDFKPNPSKDNQITQASAPGRQIALNLTTAQPHASSSQPVVNRSSRVESLPPVLSNRMALTPDPVASKPIASLSVSMPETWQGGEVARNRYQKSNSMAAQIEKLERTVAELSAQLTAQKDFQQPVSSLLPQQSQPQVIIQKPASRLRAPQAFWERSYVSRLYRWSRR